MTIRKLRSGRTFFKAKELIFLCEDVDVIKTLTYGKKVVLRNPFFFKNEKNGECKKIYMSKLPLFIENI